MANEAKFQASLIKDLEDLFPGIIVLKNDPQHTQGMLDLTLLWGPHWGSLEVKDSEKAAHQPNQDYYVKTLDDMSFAAFIYPENKAEVLNALQQAFSS